MNQFSRLQMLIGEEALLKLKNKKVLIFGLGGVGGNAIDALARSGLCSFTIVDNDKVNITNINRQLIANLDTIGRYKVDVMEEHLKSINKDIVVIKKNMFYLPENGDEFDLTVYNIYGQSCMRKKVYGENTRVYVGDLPSGTYLFRICDNGGRVIVKKIIKSE